MPRLSALAILAAALLVVGCASQSDDYAERMGKEHAHDSTGATPMTEGADSLDVTAETVAYADVNGRAVEGYLARPADADSTSALPGIIVIHEWWGLNDNVRAMTRKLADQGYTALAVDLYGGQAADSPDRAQALMQEATADSAAIDDNLRQAYAYLTLDQGAPRVASLGWCFGGGMSLRAALALPDELAATVIYYGQLVTDPNRLADLDMPIIGFFGAEDQGIPVSSVRAFETAMADVGKADQVQMYVYEGANHAFANPTGDRYDPEAARDAWEKTLAFLREHLQG